MDVGGSQWLVAPSRVSNWVRNVRAPDEVTLTRRQQTDKYRANEVIDTGAVPVLRAYIKGVRVTRPYFEATPDSSDDELLAELRVHPVFGFHLSPNRPNCPTTTTG
jgi:hypothetical protein